MWIGIRDGCVSQWLRLFFVDQNREFGCHVLVVRRNNVKHSADGMLVWSFGRHAGQMQYGRTAYAMVKGGQQQEKAGHSPRSV